MPKKYDALIRARLREGATDMDIVDALVYHGRNYHGRMSNKQAERILSDFWQRN
jgi:hypothetical protein